MQLLKDLYFGKYCPADAPLSDDPAYQAACEAVKLAREALRRNHPDLTFDDLDDLDLLYADLSLVHQEIAFRQGVNFCVRLFSESLLSA